MERIIPKQLTDKGFRFYLLKKDTKSIPIEKDYKKTKNYPSHHVKISMHLDSGGNIGLVTGYSSLIVIDFDDKDYQDIKAKLLPKTFTVLSANKRLKHLYYTLEGEMIRKIGIGIEKRLADIQAGKETIVCPPSSINGRCYDVANESPIANISCETLTKVFGISNFRQPREHSFNGEAKIEPEKIQEAIDYLLKIGVKRTKQRHFYCPFHNSNSGSCLWVTDTGGIHCFHCNKHYFTLADFRFSWENEINEGILIE